MTNVLNSILANQAIKPSAQTSMQRGKNPAFTFTTDGKVKPLADKATLLPSKIFGSPVDYVKDLKQDIVNIGRAAKGKANDHELGRINDVAMKLGSLALASYLFCKTPTKLGKAMEFVGFGTFFGSMALWPKLTIQAPLKARTGVDIHRKYVDSQGRKKMLHQDPQYDLTDLYGQKDLELIGKKCNVNENLPDRERFIKQRANKIATQGNTLWMMTAGVAPIMSGLACNVLEKPIAKTIEVVDLKRTQKAVDALASNGSTGLMSTIKQKKAIKAVEKFLQENAGREVDKKLIEELSGLVGAPTEGIKSAFIAQLEELAIPTTAELSSDQIKSTIKALLSNLEDMGYLTDVASADALLTQAKFTATSPSGVAEEFIQQLKNNGLVRKSAKAKELLENSLTASSRVKPTLGSLSGKVKTMQSSLLEFARKKGVLDKFQEVRIGKNADSYIAHQWGHFADEMVDALGITRKELNQLKAISRRPAEEMAEAQGTLLAQKLAQLAKNPEKYNEVVAKLADMLADYDRIIGSEFETTVVDRMKNISSATNGQLASEGLDKFAEQFSAAVAGLDAKGTVLSVEKVNVKERIAGAKASFHRVLQTLDLFKRAESDSFKEQVKTLLKNKGMACDPETVESYIKAAKTFVLEATDTTMIEKLKSPRFDKILGHTIDNDGFEVIMSILYDQKEGVGSALRDAAPDKADSIMAGFKTYLNDMVHLAKKENHMNPDVKGFGENLVTSADAKGKDIGKQMVKYFQDVADSAFNSKKWKLIFGGAMLAVTAVTVASTFFIGRKGKMEKQVEQELKLNG